MTYKCHFPRSNISSDCTYRPHLTEEIVVSLSSYLDAVLKSPHKSLLAETGAGAGAGAGAAVGTGAGESKSKRISE